MIEEGADEGAGDEPFGALAVVEPVAADLAAPEFAPAEFTIAELAMAEFTLAELAIPEAVTMEAAIEFFSTKIVVVAPSVEMAEPMRPRAEALVLDSEAAPTTTATVRAAAKVLLPSMVVILLVRVSHRAEPFGR